MCGIRVLGLSVAGAAGVASGQVVLTSSLTVDNIVTASISTDDSVQGDVFLTNSSWPALSTVNVDITAAGTYYLHVLARDVGRPEMFIGEFTLSSPDAQFENGTQSLLTGDPAWRVSNTGFGQDYVAPTIIGPNGTSPWGTFAIDPAAQFIWHPSFNSTVYFSTSFTVVPAPAAGSLLGLGLLAGVRRR